MTARLSIHAPLASAEREAQFEPQAKEAAAWLSTSRDAAVTPLAEHIVLDCLRALQTISLSPYAKELTDMIALGYVDTPEPIVRMRRITALLKISKGEAP